MPVTSSTTTSAVRIPTTPPRARRSPDRPASLRPATATATAAVWRTRLAGVKRNPTTPVRLSWDGVVARRLERHALSAPSAELDPAGVAAVLCGAHAQVLSAAELSIVRRI